MIIHPLSDDRRFLPIEKKGQVIEAVDEFMLVISYNPGYQSVLKELKQSTKQRFLAIEFTLQSRSYLLGRNGKHQKRSVVKPIDAKCLMFANGGWVER